MFGSYGLNTCCSYIPPKNYPALPYYLRKGYHSINCQIIVDSDYRILNMNTRFPGSSHDTAIFPCFIRLSNVMEILLGFSLFGVPETF